MKISFDLSSFIDNLSDDEIKDLKNKLNYAGYSTDTNLKEVKNNIKIFIEDNSLDNIVTKEDLWEELINFGYKLGDRILSFNSTMLYGSDVEELQELLSRMGFYSEPINGLYSNSVAEAVTRFQENRGLAIDGVVGLNTVYEIRKLVRPGQEISLNEAIKSISPNLVTGTIGFNVCFDVPNTGSYKEQINFYQQIRKSCINEGMIPIFASEVNEDLDIKNKIQYINNLQPTLFISFNQTTSESINYFKGRFSESIIGKRIAEDLSKTLGVQKVGKSSNILKETKSVGIVINGKIYQKYNVENIIKSLFNSLENQFES